MSRRKRSLCLLAIIENILIYQTNLSSINWNSLHKNKFIVFSIEYEYRSIEFVEIDTLHNLSFHLD